MILTIDDRTTRRKLEFFTEFTLSLKHNAIGSAFSFSFYFNPDNQDHLLLAQIGRYQLARVYHNDQLILTGFVLSQSLTEQSEKVVATISGYSVPGVLEDSNIPKSVYPLEFTGLSLKQIAQKILKPFVIKMVIDDSVAGLMNEVFEETKAEPAQTVKDFFTELAKQKNIIVSHTANGQVLFTRTKSDQKPIMHFESGVIGVSIGLTFNGQAMHSPIVAMKQASKDEEDIAGEATVINPYVPKQTTAFRPKTILQSSGKDDDTLKFAQNELASELRAIGLTIAIDRWDINGVLIMPNQMISVKSPRLFINQKTNFLIEEVDYKGNPEAFTAVMKCVLPEVYNGQQPKTNIFFR